MHRHKTVPRDTALILVYNPLVIPLPPFEPEPRRCLRTPNLLPRPCSSSMGSPLPAPTLQNNLGAVLMSIRSLKPQTGNQGTPSTVLNVLIAWYLNSYCRINRASSY